MQQQAADLAPRGANSHATWSAGGTPPTRRKASWNNACARPFDRAHDPITPHFPEQEP